MGDTGARAYDAMDEVFFGRRRRYVKVLLVIVLLALGVTLLATTKP